MYISREQLWWTLPIVIALFLIGGTIAKLQESEKKTVAPTSSMEAVQTESEQKERELISHLLGQLAPDKQTPLSVETGSLKWTGHFKQETFSISASQDGRELTLQRTPEGFVYEIDGMVQEMQALPYSLFTPFEHARLIRDKLPSIFPKPLPVSGAGWRGYQLTMPAKELNAVVSTWLGPAFSEAEIADALQQTYVVYQLWFEPDSKQMKQLTMAIIDRTQQGSRVRDQVMFRF